MADAGRGLTGHGNSGQSLWWPVAVFAAATFDTCGMLLRLTDDPVSCLVGDLATDYWNAWPFDSGVECRLDRSK